MTVSTKRLMTLALVPCMALSACETPLDFDLRGGAGAFTTAPAARAAVANRPDPDARGVLSYPNYQVAVARRGDTVESLAARVGTPVEELARFNGLEPQMNLRQGEIVALPQRVPELGTPATAPAAPENVDVAVLAGRAIDAAEPTPPTAAPAPVETKPLDTPTRHKVVRGETAFTIARSYNVPVRSLAEWNGLGADYAIREGQFLLIPVARQAPPARATEEEDAIPPGTGSPTPLPPSSSQPLPDEEIEPLASVDEAADEQGADLRPATKSEAAMALPVDGSIVRAYAKGKNEGIDIKGKPGANVRAADDGTVAAITKSADGVPIIVVRHAGNLLTVYTEVTDVQVKKGDVVGRGDTLAKLRKGDDSIVHFEVRDGFDAVDPMTYLE